MIHKSSMNAPDSACGDIVSIRGSVVDVRFPRLPAVNDALEVLAEPHAILETMTHLNPETVRTIALTSTQGLHRGAPVRNTGGPLRVPVWVA